MKVNYFDSEPCYIVKITTLNVIMYNEQFKELLQSLCKSLKVKKNRKKKFYEKKA